MKLFIIMFFLTFMSQVLIAQKVELRCDTVTIVTVCQVDEASKLILTSGRYFLTDDQCYSVDNLPFESLRTKCLGSLDRNSIILSNYEAFINYKSINKLLKTLKKKKIMDIEMFLGENQLYSLKNRTLVGFLNCLKSQEVKGFRISIQKIIVAYFLLDCEMKRGTNDPVFCVGGINLTKTPVVLNVVKIIDP